MTTVYEADGWIVILCMGAVAMVVYSLWLGFLSTQLTAKAENAEVAAALEATLALVPTKSMDGGWYETYCSNCDKTFLWFDEDECLCTGCGIHHWKTEAAYKGEDI